jgi:hypothetical protein
MDRVRMCIWFDSGFFSSGRWNQPKPGHPLHFFASLRLGEKRSRIPVTENAIAREIVDAAFRIHTILGPGLLESVYETVLAYELGRWGLRTVR